MADPISISEVEQTIIQRIKEDQKAGFANFTIRRGMIRYVEGLCDIGIITDAEDLSGILQIVQEYTSGS